MLKVCQQQVLAGMVEKITKYIDHSSLQLIEIASVAWTKECAGIVRIEVVVIII